MAKTDTNQPLQPDSTPLADALGPSPIERLVEDNRAGIILAIAGIVAIACAAILFRGLGQEKLVAAGEAFSKAETVDEFDKVIEEFGGTIVAGNALLKQAELLEDDGDVDAAQAVLLRFRDQFREHPRYDQALVTLGRIAEDAANFPQAERFFSEVSPESDLAPYARIHLGDLAMQEGDYEKARTIYEPIQQEYSGNAWMGLWQQRIELVKRLSAEDESAEKAEEPATEVIDAEPTKPEPAEAESSDVSEPVEAESGDAPKPAEAETLSPETENDSESDEPSNDSES